MTDIIDILVCPITKGRLVYDKNQQLLISYQAKLAFPIVNGVPDMRVDHAVELESSEKEIKHKNSNSK